MDTAASVIITTDGTTTMTITMTTIIFMTIILTSQGIYEEQVTDLELKHTIPMLKT